MRTETVRRSKDAKFSDRISLKTAGRRAWKKDRTKEKILQVALALFQKKGFEGTTTKEIARKAGIAEGTIFNYFRTKEDIALYFFEKEMEHVIDSFEDDRHLKKAPLEEKLFVLIQRQLEYLAPYEKFIGAVLIHALKPSSKPNPFSLESQELHIRYLKFVQGLFEEATQRGEISSLGWWAPQVFSAFYMGILLYWLNDDSPEKENTLAFLDRSLKIGGAIMKKVVLK